jgi:phospholipid-binding lipoprotein MlaA
MIMYKKKQELTNPAPSSLWLFSVLCAWFTVVLPVAAMDHHSREVEDATYTEYSDIAPSQAQDVCEPFNRWMLKMNDTLLGVFLKPVATMYSYIVPEWGRERVGSVVQNLATPVHATNYLLQGRADLAVDHAWRFILNSTFGIGGAFDFAAQAGLPGRSTDGGLTLSYHCVDEGPYLILPLLGPSNGRDLLGRGFDFIIDPWTYALETEYKWVRMGVIAVDKEASTMELQKQIDTVSLDRYATIRSLYTQLRAKRVRELGPRRCPNVAPSPAV